MERAFLPFIAMAIQQIAQVGTSVASKVVMSSEMSVFTYSFYSSALSTLILLPLSFLVHRSALPPLWPTFLYGFFLLGLMGFLMQILGVLGIQYSSPLLSTAISQLSPGFTFTLAVILRMEKFDYKSSTTLAKSIGTLVLIIGALVATLYKGPQILENPLDLILKSHYNNFLNQSSTWIIGGLLSVITTLTASAFIISQAFVLEKYPSELIIMLFYSSCITILSFVLSLITTIKDWNSWSLSPHRRLMAIIYAGLFGNTFLGSITSWCVRKRGPLFVAMFHPLGIVIAMGADLFLGESLHIGSMMGSVIIALGFYLVIWGKSKEWKREENNLGKSLESNRNNMPLLQNKDGDDDIEVNP